MTRASWAIAFVTMERPIAAQRFVRSARRMFPDVPIFVAEQSRDLGVMAEFYDAERVTVVRMPFDAGLSASRNALVGAMSVDYFALCDDDFILGPATRFSSAINVLEQSEDLGVIGGMLHDYDGTTEWIRHWEMFFDHDERHGRFTATPIYNYPPVIRQIAGETIYLCDAVMNFAVFRRAMFSSLIRWEQSIKINGEHEDFYLGLKRNSPYGVGYLPTMAALHWHVQRAGDYAALRARRQGRQEFLKKWRLSSHLEIGSGRRALDGTPASAWFFADHDQRGADASSADVSAGVSRRKLYRTNDLDEPTQVTASLAPASFHPWIIDEGTAHAAAPGRHLFRYQPAASPDGDLMLWHRIRRSKGDCVDDGTANRVVVRWFCPTGKVVGWDSETHTLPSAGGRYWQALAVPIPLWPKGAEYLRFDIICASQQRTPLASGFVFADNRSAISADVPEVLALCITTANAENVDAPAGSLAEILASAPQREMELVCDSHQPWVLLDVSNLSIIGVYSPRRQDVFLAAGLARESIPPLPLALPSSVATEDVVLFAVEAGYSTSVFVVAPRLVNTPGPD